MKSTLTLILCMLLTVNALAKVTIQGVVSNSVNNKPLANINILLKDKQGTQVIAFSRTNNSGAYSVDYTGTADSVMITITGFNIAQQQKTIKANNQTVDFKALEQAISLKEVKIKPTKINERGDTLNYNVNSYTDKNDRVIADVLKKLPGIEVAESGRILYNGKPINKFYIEDLDMLKGRYGLATNNISAKDIATVQVYEYHQPIKALRDKQFSEYAAINLKLKDAAHGIHSINALFGLGYKPLLYNTELISMYFSKGNQMLNTYKGNNSGDDVSRELTSFESYSSDGLTNQNTLSVQYPQTPNISAKRYLKNQVNAFSVNTLKKLNDDYQLTANLVYLNDKQTQESFSQSDYYINNDSLLTIQEQIKAISKTNKVDVEIQLNANTSKMYMNNLVKLMSAWNDGFGTVHNSDTITQNLKQPSHHLSNTFFMVRNLERIHIQIASFNGYGRSPHQLQIQPTLYPQLFESGKKQHIQQLLTTSNFTSENSVLVGRGKQSFKQDLSIGFNVNLQQLNSTLQAQSADGRYESSDSLENKLSWNRFQWYARPGLTFNDRKLSINLGVPFSYIHLRINDQIPHQTENIDRTFFDPFLNINYKLTHAFALSASGSYSKQIGTIQNRYSSYIMHSYRYMQRNQGQLHEQRQQNYRLGASYRNPIYALFTNVGANYWQSKANNLYGVSYVDQLTVRTSLAIPNVSEGWGLSGSISKGVDFISSTVTLNAQVNQSSNLIYQQKEVLKYHQNQYSLSGSVSSHLSSWSSLMYKINYANNRFKIASGSNSQPIQDINQTTSLNIFPVDGLTFNLSWDYFYNNSGFAIKNMSFIDAGAKFKHKRIEYELTCLNLFNYNQFTSSSTNEINAYYFIYDLRPVSVLMKIRFKLL